MIEVLVLQGDQPPVHYEFQQDEIVIGRRSGNDLVLPEASVSSRHARMYLDFEKVWIEDLDSTNGTLLNGREITGPKVITYDDVVEIGDFRIKLVNAVEQDKWERLLVEGQPPDPVAPSAGPDPRATLYRPRGAEPVEVVPEPPPMAGGPEGPAPYQGPGTGFFQEEPTGLGPVSVRRAPPESEIDIELPEPDTEIAAKLPAYVPPVPRNILQTGLKRGHITDLLLKTTYFAGEISGYELADEMRLPFNDVLEPIIQELRRDKLLDVKGGGGSFGAVSMVYSVTTKASDLIQQILDRNRYTGPAPVSMADYVELVEAQSIRRKKMPKRRLLPEFGHLVLDDDIFDVVGPAINSGMAILLYGPPGNGKTAICQAMINCYDDYIFVPYAIEVDGNIIKVFDEHNHRVVSGGRVAGQPLYDERYVLCRRPLIMVGGELSLDMLDMSYSPEARFYEAPIQLKANGGILFVDDFGRQRMSPRELLNRWIVPLESEIDFISLVTGKKLRIPFDVFVVFATNLDPESLVDEAFLRRVRYKAEVGRPSWAQYRTIFERACAAHDIPFSEAGFAYLKSLYERDGRPIAACEPRNLLDAVRSLGEYFEREPELTPEFLDRAYRSYFTRIGKRTAGKKV